MMALGFIINKTATRKKIEYKYFMQNIRQLGAILHLIVLLPVYHVV